MSFFHKLEEAIHKAPETILKGLDHAEATIEGIIFCRNPDLMLTVYMKDY